MFPVPMVADMAVVTSDNPRSEDPASIVGDIVTPMTDPHIELDRRAAIHQAVLQADAGDVVVVAGKGHEVTQTLADRVVPFDDAAVAREALARRVEERGLGA